MVLEQLFKPDWIEKKPRHAFLLGLIYSIVGAISAKLVFGANPGMMTVAFTSILLLPSLNTLLQIEENQAREKHKYGMLKQLWKDHADIVEVYFYMFMGIFLTFCIIAFTFPEDAVLKFFAPMFEVIGISGNATTISGWATSVAGPTILSIFINNFTVTIVCLLLSLVYGAGAIVFITWNAVVWGVVIGYFAKQALVSTANAGLFTTFFTTVLPFFPHMVLEALPYFTASIVGGIVSKAALREELFSPRFNEILEDAAVVMGMSLVILLIAAIVEIKVYPLLA
ncbi:stage II sporulation protein M [Candidatus Woesearchaeota archaeon]|nr:stage II sporulation protein M [Candidatus Woesearchaeota archaeon]